MFFALAAGEELGWMGYAVDPMQERWSALTTSIVLGSVWSVAHYPSMIKQGRSLKWIAWGTLGMLGMRTLIVWLYNNTGKSLFAVIFFHAMANVGRVAFPADKTHNPLGRLSMYSLFNPCGRSFDRGDPMGTKDASMP